MGILFTRSISVAPITARVVGDGQDLLDGEAYVGMTRDWLSECVPWPLLHLVQT